MIIPNRKDIIDRDSNKAVINLNRQQLIGILGRRGTGKSYLNEAIITKFFEVGYTVLDLWSSDNWENAFWCIPKLEEDKIVDFMRNPDKYNKKTRFPITILCAETLRYDQEKLDKFNGKYFTANEFYRYYQGQHKNYDLVYPQKKPESLYGKEWIEFVSLPRPTAKYDSEINHQIAEIVEKTIIHCRQERRILVFNPRAFPDELQMFRTLEIIIRNLGNIALRNFRKLSPQEIGKNSRSEMSNKERAWDKMIFCIREFGELAPAKLKADSSGESTKVKKALLQFVRKARHYQISGVFDYQNASDVESSIRNQIDVWLIKKWTERLGGIEFEWAFRKINSLRSAVIQKYNGSRKGLQLADRVYPPIASLGQKYMYVVFGNDMLKILKVPEVKTRHKEPFDVFEKFTGIEFWHDKSMIQSTYVKEGATSSSTDEKALYNAIYAMRNPKSGKKASWDKIKEKLSDMQEKNEIHWMKPIKDIEKYTLQKQFKRMEVRYDKE